MKNKVHFITKKFAHHSQYSGYDRILDFTPHSPLPFFPAALFFSEKYKGDKIANCPARWDHYGKAELDTELNIRCYPSLLNKHLFHFIYGENTFCHSADSNRSNKVFLATYHQPETWFKSSGNERYEYFTSRMRLLDGVIAVSENQADFFRQFNKNVFCVHHGIDVDFFTPASPEERDPELCLFVGNWLRDFDTLNKCSVILKNRSPNIKLHVVTPEKNKSLLENSELEIFSGISDLELREKYRKASVVILPLKDCTANNSALEAMSCGVPIVVSDVGGIRDYVTEDFGVFCAPGDADGMVTAVIALLGDKEKRTAMGIAARKRAEIHFAWPVVAKQLEDAYRQLLNN